MSNMAFRGHPQPAAGGTSLPRLPELDQMPPRYLPSMQMGPYDEQPNSGPSARPAEPRRPPVITSADEDSYCSSTSSGHPSPVTTESRESVIYTPVDSRRPSASSVVSHEQSILTRARCSTTSSRQASSLSNHFYCKHCKARACKNPEGHRKNMNKNRKAQRSRKEQGDVHRDSEDILRFLCGWISPHELKKSNANSAGLTGLKLYNELAIATACRHFCEEARMKAHRENRVDEFEAEMRNILNAGIEHGPFHDGILLNRTDAPCERLGDQKACIVHGNAEWVQCRLETMGNNFRTNERRILKAIHRKRAAKVTPQSPLRNAASHM